MQYSKVREVLANDFGNANKHIVGRDENAPFESWLQHGTNEAVDPLSAEDSKLLGHWYYDGEREVFIVDRTTATFIGATDHHEAQSTHILVRNLNSFDATRFYLNMNEDIMGDVIFEHITMSEGPYKGRSFVVQGSILQRREDGTALCAVGYMSFENSPHSELIPREISGDGMYIWDSATNELVCSASYHAMIGYKEEEFPRYIDDFIARVVHPDDNDFFMVLSHMCQSVQYGDYFESCMRIRHKDGHYLWCVCRGLVQERDINGRARRVIGTLTNINLVQSSFDNIKLMMFTDSLTGLHNRNFFLQNYPRYEDTEVLPVSVIFIDISGLKLTNDILGHSHGDYLLIKARDLIRDGISASSYAKTLKTNQNTDDSDNGNVQQIIPGTESLTKSRAQQDAPITQELESITTDKPIVQDDLVYQLNAGEQSTYEHHMLFDLIKQLDGDEIVPPSEDPVAQKNLDALIHQHQKDPIQELKELQESNNNTTEHEEQDATVEIMRLAGDEFLVILPYCDKDQVDEIARNIDKLRADNNEYHKQHTPIDTSPVPIFFGIGCATFYGSEDGSQSLKSVIDQADELMQINKDERRSEFYAKLKAYFELKKGRPVSMRDERRVNILTEEERSKMRDSN